MYQFTDEEKSVVKKAISIYGVDNQIIVAIEELSELTHAILGVDNDAVVEELADVQISLFTLSLCNIKFGENVRPSISIPLRCLNLIKDLTKLLRIDINNDFRYDTIAELQNVINTYIREQNIIFVHDVEIAIKTKIKRLEERINSVF